VDVKGLFINNNNNNISQNLEPMNNYIKGEKKNFCFCC